jgi:hypothetical protein
MFPNHAPCRAKHVYNTALIFWMVGDMIAGSYLIGIFD